MPRPNRIIRKAFYGLAAVLIGSIGLYAGQDRSVQAQEQVGNYVPGRTYWGSNGYIEYIAGDMPLIISAPHGGYLKPAEIPDRTWGGRDIDSRSQEYTREVAGYIHQLTGKYPHVIINNLHRSKLDANREIVEAAQGNPIAERAWYEFHQFIDIAEATVVQQYGRGVYLDFHTNYHRGNWVELGYLLLPTDLNRSDDTLNASKYKNRSSVKSLAYSVSTGFADLIRGRDSLGGLLQGCGFKSVPSPEYPGPGSEDYFNGGYNTVQHGSREGGTIDGIQVESNRAILSDNVRDPYSRALAQSLVFLLHSRYGFTALNSEDASAPQAIDLGHNVYLAVIPQSQFPCQH